MSRGLPVVVLEHAAKPLPAANLVGHDRPGADRWRGADRRGEAERGMRPLAVVVVDVLGQEMVQVPSPEHDEVVEAFGLDALDQSFDMGVEVGRGVRQAHRLDPGLGQGRTECAIPPAARGELAVAVVEQQLWQGHALGQRSGSSRRVSLWRIWTQGRGTRWGSVCQLAHSLRGAGHPTPSNAGSNPESIRSQRSEVPTVIFRHFHDVLAPGRH